MGFVLAHISDVHLGPLPHVHLIDLMSKRITGYVNWKRSRASQMAGGAVTRLVAALQEQGPDHIAVTGDLTNLALKAEIFGASAWLRDLGDPHDVSAIPGNHDAYVPGALRQAVSVWAPFMRGDDIGAMRVTRLGFPYLRARGCTAIIGVNSAVATAPFMASGVFGRQQAIGLGQALDTAGTQGLFRVVLIHHPPVRNATTPHKRLLGIRRFQKVITNHGAELILHGHTHLPQRNAIRGIDGSPVPVIGVPAGGQAPGGKHPAAAYNLFHVEGEPGRWRCSLEEYSLTGRTGNVSLTDKRELS